MTPFCQASRHSLAYQFTINALLCPPHSQFLENNLHFQPCFGQNFNSQDTNFPNFRSQDPSFSRKIRSLDPTFWNPCGTHSTKKAECPPSSHKYTKLVQLGTVMHKSYLHKDVLLYLQNLTLTLIFTLTQLLYYKILQIMNTFDNIIRHVKVPHTWQHVVPIVQYSYQHSVGLDWKSIL